MRFSSFRGQKLPESEHVEGVGSGSLREAYRANSIEATCLTFRIDMFIARLPVEK
jgi:hypothetical protein